MAYHYSIQLKDLSPAEVAWWKNQVQHVLITEEGHEYADEDSVPASESIEYEGWRGLHGLSDWSGAADDPSIEVTIGKDSVRITDNEDESANGWKRRGTCCHGSLRGSVPTSA
jgi:hypothetical protein